GDGVLGDPRADRRAPVEFEDQRVTGDGELMDPLHARAVATVDPGAGGIGLLEVREAEAAEGVEATARLGAEHAVVVPVAAERRSTTTGDERCECGCGETHSDEAGAAGNRSLRVHGTFS